MTLRLASVSTVSLRAGAPSTRTRQLISRRAIWGPTVHPIWGLRQHSFRRVCNVESGDTGARRGALSAGAFPKRRDAR
jgi:hypothetical protein